MKLADLLQSNYFVQIVTHIVERIAGPDAEIASTSWKMMSGGERLSPRRLV